MRLLPLTREQLDIRDHAAVEALLRRERPEMVINTAAYPRVDNCEDNAAEAFLINAVAVHRLARACAVHHAVLLHFSADYVFSGLDRRTPYGEDGAPEPLSVYGASKLAGEQLVRAGCRRYFVVRSCGLYGLAGSRGKGGNFVETMLRLPDEHRPIRVVTDQSGEPDLDPRSGREAGRAGRHRGPGASTT